MSTRDTPRSRATSVFGPAINDRVSIWNLDLPLESLSFHFVQKEGEVFEI
jgi:hypothetical protein